MLYVGRARCCCPALTLGYSGWEECGVGCTIDSAASRRLDRETRHPPAPDNDRITDWLLSLLAAPHPGRGTVGSLVFTSTSAPGFPLRQSCCYPRADSTFTHSEDKTDTCVSVRHVGAVASTPPTLRVRVPLRLRPGAQRVCV
eukprot:GHVU01012982.1.p3 GENE.GHVU01012982.1~~GHVU01012982.1.p3  ORF type:complete len:143 (-),score=1.66 GHVU01012982.1:2005-2433(-)